MDEGLFLILFITWLFNNMRLTDGTCVFLHHPNSDALTVKNMLTIKKIDLIIIFYLLQAYAAVHRRYLESVVF